MRCAGVAITLVATLASRARCLSSTTSDIQEQSNHGDAVLRTDGSSSRTIQVDGPVGTTDGGIHFQGR